MPSTASLLAAVVVAAASLSSAGAAKIGFGPGPDVTLDWTVAGGNITFTMQCNPNAKYGPLAWCAWGINTANTPSMVPVDAVWLAVDTTGKALPVEDRNISAIGQPACFPAPLTTTLSSSYDSNSGALSATYTRTLAVTPAQAALGYAAIPNALVQVVAAVGGGPRPAGPCAMTQQQHYGAFGDVSINFQAA